MSEDSSQEKTEQATPKRLDDAKRKGQVARSKDLNATMVLLAGGIGLLLYGDNLSVAVIQITQKLFNLERIYFFQVDKIADLMVAIVYQVLFSLVPLLIVIALFALLSPMFLGGWSFSFESLAPKGERLSPLKGIKRIFGLKGLMEMVKAFLKFALVAIIAFLVIYFEIDYFFALDNADVHTAIVNSGYYLVISFLIICFAMVIISAIDVPFQLFEHQKQLKMTKQEVKDEMKDSEGKPEVKGQIRRMQREMSERRMMEKVPEADVVLTNPTHYSVALKYEDGNGGAPKVIAKGEGYIALQIRKVAEENKITLISSPPLTRAIYHSTDLNREIPAGLYIAVAKILAYVYQLKRYEHNRRNGKPKMPSDLPIPDELQR